MNKAAPQVATSTFEPRVSDPRWSERLGDVSAVFADVFFVAAKAMNAAGEVAVLFTSDAEMRELNRRWRNIDKPTDVLSFPSDGPQPPGEPKFHGDIALGFETALSDAEAMQQPFEAHVAHLLVHGFLHLLGYDHMKPEDAAVMEPLEVQILGDLGWPNPYDSRYDGGP